MPTTQVKFEIVYNDSLIMNPSDPTAPLIFDTEEDANQYIVDNELNPVECVIFPITITE